MEGRELINLFILRVYRLVRYPFRRNAVVLGKIRNNAATRFFYENLAEPAKIQHNQIDEATIIESVNGNTVLDCGCGIGRWGYLLSKKGFAVVGFDLRKANVMEAKKYSKYQGLVIADASSLPFKDATFDCLTAVEILEHLPKEKGKMFLNETKRLTRQKIVLTTPSGFFEVAYNVPEEKHETGWEKEELENQGFSVITKESRLYNWLLCIYSKTQ